MFSFLLVLLIFNNELCQIESNSHPDIGLTTVQLVKRQDYPVEEYKNVQTPDGYLLTLHRIPRGKQRVVATKRRPVVFLMPGLLCSSTIWVNMGPTKSLAYLLADAGYDVWMGNPRGTMFSRNHIKYDPDLDTEFWQFSWHEIGTVDLPTMIDYILSKTKQSQLYYIGHSQGTTTFFVMASELPEYNKKIKLMIALAPVTFSSNMENKLIKWLAVYYNYLHWAVDFVGVGEFLSSELLRNLIQATTACDNDSNLQDMCINIIFLVAGWDKQQLNTTMIPVITSTIPAGCSSRQLVHFAQLINTGRFCQYDHGNNDNQIIYGNSDPPDYNLSLVTSPVVLIHAQNDLLLSEQDVKQLADALPNVVSKYLIPYKMFSHYDYLFANDVKSLVYDKVLQFVNTL